MEERQQSLEIDVNTVDNCGGAPTTDDGDNVENSLLSKPGVEQFIKQCLSRPGCCLRLMNIAFYAIFAIILFRVPVEQNEPRIGIVYQSTEVKDFIPQPDGTTIGTWGGLGYPIKLNNELCTVDILWSCDNEAGTGVCCDELQNPNSSGPESSISSHLLGIIAFAVPFIFIGLRMAIMAYFSVVHDTETWRTFSGFYSFDAVLGFGAAIIFNYYMSEFAKEYVGSPRPNFYAYRYWNEHAKQTGTFTLDNSFDSWVSGHAGDTMLAAVYVVLILWSDLRAASSLTKNHVIMAALISLGHLLCCGIIYGYAFVGFSRIREYWHHTVDVITGWVFGTAAAFVAFTFVTKGPYNLNMAYYKRKYATVGHDKPQ